MSERQPASVVVVGAGSSGLAVIKALRDCDIRVECFERGASIGGMWRYENDNGLSGAYESLRTNVSRAQMQYPSFPIPAFYDEFPHHRQMAAYLDEYASAFGLEDDITFGATVSQLWREPDGRWCVTLDDGSRRHAGSVVVATGVFWQPRMPVDRGHFDGEISHSHGYRRPESFGGRRVLVVGSGQSAAEIAVEISTVAERVFLSVRNGAHVLPRLLGERPYDADDVSPLNRLPWRLLNALYSARVQRELDPLPESWPVPTRRLLEGIPIVSSELLPAVRRDQIAVKPALEQLAGDRVEFVDGSKEEVDRIVYATGYRMSVPFLDGLLPPSTGRDFPLYRRIVPPGLEGLYFAGFLDAPGGLLPIVELQGRWLAAVLRGRLRLPSRAEMWRAVGAERRTRQRFPEETAHSIRCDPHAYRRRLEADLRGPRRYAGAPPRYSWATLGSSSRRGPGPVRATRPPSKTAP